MKKLIAFLFIIFLCGCNSIKQDMNQTENTIHNKEQHNQSEQENIRDAHAMQALKQHLNITQENENLFTFEILDREHTYMTIKVISNEMQQNGGSGTVGIYIVDIDGKVMEKRIPDDVIGTWSGKHHDSSEDITYTFTKDNKITVNNHTYIITNCNTTFHDTITTYEFAWDVEAFTQMYGNDSIGFGPQALIVSYHADTDTIDVGTILKKVNT